MTNPLATGLYFEAPRWHDGRLWVVDSPARKVLSIGAAGDAQTVCHVEDGIPCGLGFLPDGDLIIVSMFNRTLRRFANGRLDLYADLSTIARGTIDDMVIDDKGRAYVGDLGANLLAGAVKGPIGGIVLVAPDGRARTVAEGLSFPNGIAIRGDDLVVAESDGDCLAHYKIKSDGALDFVRRFGTLREPDGVCFDAEGCVWTALFKEDAFVRVDLDGNERQRIKTAAGRGIACVLGGPARKTLFCLSAETTHEDLMRGKTTARIDAVEVAVAGAGFP